MQGLSRQFDKEFWNYAKLISGTLRHGMPLPFVVNLVSNLTFEQDHINTWKNGIVRALKNTSRMELRHQKKNSPKMR